MKEFFFSRKGIYYRTNTFHPNRKTLVFVHGLSGSSSAWAKFEKKFQDTFNIVSFDLRGHGKSEKHYPYEAYRIDSFADDLHELLKYLRIEKCILISHSFGCFIAFAFLKKHQNKVSKAVFLSPNYSVYKMPSARIIRPILSVGVSLLKHLPFPLKIRGHVDYSQYSDTGGDWNIPITTANIIHTSLRVYLYATKHSYDFDSEDFLKKIHIPILVMHGKNDTIFPIHYGVSTAEKIPNAKLIILEKANHILVLNNFNEVSRAIKDFVDETTEKSAS
jgi:pimeloyl-ACP methyl ester carboxylesterase